MWNLIFYCGVSYTTFPSRIQLIFFDEKSKRSKTFPFAVIHPNILYTLIKVGINTWLNGIKLDTPEELKVFLVIGV